MEMVRDACLSLSLSLSLLESDILFSLYGEEVYDLESNFLFIIYNIRLVCNLGLASHRMVILFVGGRKEMQHAKMISRSVTCRCTCLSLFLSLSSLSRCIIMLGSAEVRGRRAA